MDMSGMHHNQTGISGSTGDAMSDSMRSTFGSWSQFQLKLLFETWNITEQWQFALTWFAVVTSVVVYHLLEYALLILQHGMLALLSQSQGKEMSAIVRPSGWLLLKMMTGFIIACKYGLSLFFMMIAMTFNPSLFLALVIGYLVGGYACCELKLDQKLLGTQFAEFSSSTATAIKWWTQHSPHEHFVLIAGVLVFPTALVSGYGLIHNTCYYYTPGQQSSHEVDDWPGTLISEGKAPFVGGWIPDWCGFESEPTNKMSIQQSIGVFYGFLAITTSIMLLAKRYKSVFTFLRKEVIQGRNVTNGEVIMTSGVAALLIFNFAFWYNRYTFMIMNGTLYMGWMKGTSRQPWFFATQVTGRLLDVSLGLLTIPVAKNSVLQLLLGISYDASIRFHKNMGWIFVIISVVHVGVYMKSAKIDEEDGGQSLLSHMFNTPDSHMSMMNQMVWGQGNWMTVMGTYATILMIPPILFAFPFVRRQCYNLFYYSHLFLHVGVVFLWLHASSDFYYMLPAIGFYAVDLSVRLYARFAYRTVTAISKEPGGLVRIDFDNSKLPGLQNYTYGQFVRVCFPTLNSFEWHPFTICGPRTSGFTTILLNPAITAGSGKSRQNDWSSAMCRKVTVGTPISIDGAFGTGLSFEPNDMDVVVCLVGGSGISLGLSVAQCVTSKATRVIILWSVRSDDHTQFLSCLHDLPDNTAVVVYYTSSNLALVDDTEASYGEKANKIRPGKMIGRIPFLDELKAIDIGQGRNMGVVICGPPGFTTAANDACCEFSSSTDNSKVSISSESFSL